MLVREEVSTDRDAVRRVNVAAFGRAAEAELVDALRAGGYARLSLVAEVDGEVVGHVLFSDLPIRTVNTVVPALALAPLAVLPAFQRRGVGAELVREGLRAAATGGHRIVVVLGDPAYYRRFGFSAALAKPLRSAFAGEAFMTLELVAGALDGVEGDVDYPPPFGAL